MKFNKGIVNKLLDAIIIKLFMLKAKYRVLFGFCPLCNSDAPELDNCSLCNGYHQAKGDKFPPKKELKNKWLQDYEKVLYSSRMIKELVRVSRKNRKDNKND